MDFSKLTSLYWNVDETGTNLSYTIDPKKAPLSLKDINLIREIFDSQSDQIRWTIMIPTLTFYDINTGKHYSSVI